jgi:enoyl-CoA hydratase/carnithine racemase
MAEDAYLLQAFIHIGLLPDGTATPVFCRLPLLFPLSRHHPLSYTHAAGSTFFLARQVGYSRALEIAVEGKPVDAKTAKSLGLANRVGS